MRDKKAYYKEWYAKNRERLIAKARAWELAHPEETREPVRAPNARVQPLP